jgi:hypothetical protein
MNYTERRLHLASGLPPAPRLNETTCVIDFFEARNRLLAGFEESGKEFDINRQGDTGAAYRRTPLQRVDRLEESLYWLLSAAMLVYFLLEIIGR